MPEAPENLREFKSLVEVVAALRGPGGCPWDREQTHQSLTQYALEEAFELAEAIDQGEMQDVVEELGDLLLQVVLHAEIARQDGNFEIADVIASINDKMIRRHPHVFADLEVKDSAEVLENWQKIKAEEKAKSASDLRKEKGERHKDFNPFNVPLNLPALLRSQKIGAKTKKVNFDWNTPEEVIAKVEEELGELKSAKTLEEKQNELGDLLFSVAQLARHWDFDAEQALRQTNRRFEHRFAKMQEIAKDKSMDFSSLSSNELEQLWQSAKASLGQ